LQEDEIMWGGGEDYLSQKWNREIIEPCSKVTLNLKFYVFNKQKMLLHRYYIMIFCIFEKP